MAENEKILAALLYDPDLNLRANEELNAQDICFQLKQLLYRKKV